MRTIFTVAALILGQTHVQAQNVSIAPPSIRPALPACLCPTAKCTCAPADCKCPSCPARSAVRVDYDLGNGAGAGGSGVVVWSKGGSSLVATNKHVVANGISGTVTYAGLTYPCRFRGWSDTGDVALLEVNKTLPVAKMADTDPAVGTVVTHYGQSTGPRTGKVVGSSWAAVPSLGWSGTNVQANYTSTSGDSGAGVYNADGLLVGIHWGGPDGAKVSAPVSVVRDLVDKIAKSPANAVAPPSTPIQFAAPTIQPACQLIPVYDRFGRVVGYRQQCPLVR